MENGQENRQPAETDRAAGQDTIGQAEEARPALELTQQTEVQAQEEERQREAADNGLTREQIDREREGFGLEVQSQPSPQGMEQDLFTADGRPTVAASQGNERETSEAANKGKGRNVKQDEGITLEDAGKAWTTASREERRDILARSSLPTATKTFGASATWAELNNEAKAEIRRVLAEETPKQSAGEGKRQEALKRLKDLFGRAYRNNRRGEEREERGAVDLFDGLTSTNSFREALQEGADRYESHGMGKSSIASALSDLMKLWDNGIDPNYGAGMLYTAPLEVDASVATGVGSGVGTAGGTSYRDGPFILVSRSPGTSHGFANIRNDLGGILVNSGLTRAYPEIVETMREVFPNLVIESFDNVPAFVRELNARNQQASSQSTGQSTTGTQEAQPVFTEYKGDPEGAIERLLREKKGEARAVVTREGLGAIDLIYGNENHGLAKIARKHSEVLPNLASLLRNGRVMTLEGNQKRYIVADGNPPLIALVALDYNGETKTWVVTSYEDRKGNTYRNLMENGVTVTTMDTGGTTVADDTARRNNAADSSIAQTDTSEAAVSENAPELTLEKAGAKSTEREAAARRKKRRERDRRVIDRITSLARNGWGNLDTASVEQVLSEALEEDREALGKAILSNRPDLADDVRQALAELRESAPANDKPAYSFSAPHSDAETVSGLRAALDRVLGKKAADRMIRDGVIVLHATPASLPDGLAQGVSQAGRVSGIYDRETNTIHLIAAYTHRGEGAAKAGHEGLHMFLEALGHQNSKAHQTMMNRLAFVARSSREDIGQWFDMALDRIQEREKRAIVNARTPAQRQKAIENYLNELGAYAVEEYERAPRSLPQAVAKWVEDFIASIRAALMDYGFEPKNLTAADLSAISRRFLRQQARSVSRNSNKDRSGAQNPEYETQTFPEGEVLASVDSPYTRGLAVIRDVELDEKAIQSALKEYNKRALDGHAERFIRQEFEEEASENGTVDGLEIPVDDIERDEDGDFTEDGHETYFARQDEMIVEAVQEAMARRKADDLEGIDNSDSPADVQQAAIAYLKAAGISYQGSGGGWNGQSYYLNIERKNAPEVESEEEEVTLKLRFANHENQTRSSDHTGTEWQWVTERRGETFADMMKLATAYANGETGIGEDINYSVDQDERPSFYEAERAYGGREAYDRAKKAGRTKLNYRQWVQVRTPEFKKWFGDWEIAGQELKPARNFAEAGALAHKFAGKPLTSADGFTATVSKTTIGKMLSASAVRKSESGMEQALAVANLDMLFERAIRGWSKADRSADANINAVHRFFAPMRVGDAARLVKFTVKEFADKNQNNRIYSVEEISVGEVSPIPEMVDADRAEDPRLLSGHIGLVESMAERVRDFNPASVSKVTDPETGEPMVMYHGAYNSGFSVFMTEGQNESSGAGVFFTSSREAAVSYAGEDADAEIVGGVIGKNGVYPAFLNVRNPKIADWGNNVWDDPSYAISQDEALEGITYTDDFSRYARRQGHDGAYIDNVADDIDGNEEYATVITVFSPNQIKSATGNTGAFSEANDDIRFSVDGDFGPVFTEYEGDPEGAIERLLREKTGEARAVVTREGLGAIDLIYGNEKGGLAHIAAEHPGILPRLPTILREGELKEIPGNRKKYLITDKTIPEVAVVSLDYNGKEKTWVVTAYEDVQGTVSGRAKTMNSGQIASEEGDSPPSRKPSTSIAQEPIGHAQPLSAKVLTPSGFKRMGDIHVGDDVIMPDGSATQVTDVFPQGKKPIYRVCLADGGSTLCTADHLWHVREEGEEEWKTITTAAILEGVKVGKRYELPEVRA